eukprot:g4449.t1
MPRDVLKLAALGQICNRRQSWKHLGEDEAPSQEEEALLGKVLCNTHLMQKTTEMLRSFQHEICGVDGFFDELGVMPISMHAEGDGQSLCADKKKDILMNLAVKAIHQAKWMSLRICYNDYMKQQENNIPLFLITKASLS